MTAPAVRAEPSTTGTGSTPQTPSRSSDQPSTGSARRGRTTIAREVVEKVAAQAAAEVGSASGRSGGFLGIGTSADASARPKVSAHLYGDFADLDLAMGIAYPGSLRRTAQQVRESVTTTVERLTGIAVHRVDIDVTFLDLGDAGDDRRSLR